MLIHTLFIFTQTCCEQCALVANSNYWDSFRCNGPPIMPPALAPPLLPPPSQPPAPPPLLPPPSQPPPSQPPAPPPPPPPLLPPPSQPPAPPPVYFYTALTLNSNLPIVDGEEQACQFYATYPECETYAIQNGHSKPSLWSCAYDGPDGSQGTSTVWPRHCFFHAGSWIFMPYCEFHMGLVGDKDNEDDEDDGMFSYPRLCRSM